MITPQAKLYRPRSPRERRRAAQRRLLLAAVAIGAGAVVGAGLACRDRSGAGPSQQQDAAGGGAVEVGAGSRPDTYPVMLNREMPFRYPPALYAEKAQGDVTLRLYVDRNGQPVQDSIRVAESSRVPLLDSAAVRGARELRFVPAKLGGAPMAVTILFPVYFRHPEARPPVDSGAGGARPRGAGGAGRQ